MESFEGKIGGDVESREQFVDKYLTVYRVRHGETAYLEHTNTDGAAIDHDLTEEGRETIVSSAEAIANDLDPERDIILLATSARQRAQDSAQIIKEVLTEKGFEVRFDHDRSVRDWLQGSDLLDDDGAVVSPGTPEHAETFTRLTALPDLNAQREKGELAELEPSDSVNARTRNHLALLTRFASQVEFPEDKRMVVVETEHEETIDELLAHASAGERSMARGSGPEKGEVVKLDIPRERSGDASTVELGVTTLTGPALPEGSGRVQFDYLKRNFE